MNSLLPLVTVAKTLATHAHEGQFRRDGTTPYITHLEAVANSVRTEEEKIVAWLHDIFEDTDYKEYHLRYFGITEDQIASVHRLTKIKNTGYVLYLKAIKEDPIARVVKIADMNHNFNDTPTFNQRIKYANGIAYLTDRITFETMQKNIEKKLLPCIV